MVDKKNILIFTNMKNNKTQFDINGKTYVKREKIKSTTNRPNMNLSKKRSLSSQRDKEIGWSSCLKKNISLQALYTRT